MKIARSRPIEHGALGAWQRRSLRPRLAGCGSGSGDAPTRSP